ncbi:SAM-dependent methyltransferase [Polaromonas eurypsychrophila]|uniref:SAM-dependent methyltransferase n=1 Tax=Polaromonas eurypsychrophila TaxID=1614635 RepID=A0A916SCN5_9BURK|nr:SAM-dependent methyltransferase [Polaromonas eurypsychrophila]
MAWVEGDSAIADNPGVTPPTLTTPPSLTSALAGHIREAIAAAGGWISFDRFMALALYTPGLGYYAHDSRKFGLMPGSGSDFVTAPELSSRFGQALSRQVAQALRESATDEVWEFGAGSGALAQQLLGALGPQVKRYTIVDLSGTLQARQRERLAAWGDTVRWVSELPAQMRGVVVGNEVLDAMPVQLLARHDGSWFERGVAVQDALFVHADQPTALRPSFEVVGNHDYLTEIHPQAEAFVATLADRLQAGAVFLIDYGFPEHEYYHPQRSMGTLMCHRGHLVDADALQDVGEKDLTAHVNFSGIALAGQQAGLQVLGYTSQARFLLNCAVLDGMEDAPLAERVMVQKLINEHEMGELFKVIALVVDSPERPWGGWQAMGFARGDRTHTL